MGKKLSIFTAGFAAAAMAAAVFAPTAFATVKPDNVHVDSAIKNAVSTSVKNAKENDTVQIIVDENYELTSVTVKRTDRHCIDHPAAEECAPLTVTDNSFKMSKGEVTVFGTIAAIHTISLSYDENTGFISTDKDSSIAGEEITLNVVPKAGYKCVSVTSEEIEGLTCDTESFIMPDEDVEISAVFEVASTPTPAPEQKTETKTVAPNTGIASTAALFAAASALTIGGAFAVKKANKA